MDVKTQLFRAKKHLRNVEWHKEHGRITFEERAAYHYKIVNKLYLTLHDVLPLMTDEDVVNIITEMESTQIG